MRDRAPQIHGLEPGDRWPDELLEAVGILLRPVLDQDRIARLEAFLERARGLHLFGHLRDPVGPAVGLDGLGRGAE